ncbi:hypothetical protein BH24CHL7_BH24CHL7_16080 [soil metagenome]
MLGPATRSSATSSGSRRRRRLWRVAGALVIAGCAAAPPVTLPPSDPHTLPPATASSTEVETAPCNQSTGGDVALEAYSEPPERPTAPGAQSPPPVPLNIGRKPPTPEDPDAVVPDDPGLGPSMLPAPGAEDPVTPESLILYQPPQTLAGAPTSQIAEPEVAVHGQNMMVTWNWGAAQSLDGGRTMQYLDPFRDVPPADDGFCCDQLVEHVPDQDLWLWVLQYLRVETQTGNNRVRLAVARGDDAFARRQFKYWDFTAQDAGLADSIWFDQPKLGLTERHLFLSINAFNPKEPFADGRFRAAVILRIDLDQLANGQEVTPTCLTTTSFGPYPVRHARDTMYLAAHTSASVLGVWRWPDDAGSPTFHRVRDVNDQGQPVAYPLRTEPYSCQRTGAPSEAASDWCARSDDRLHSGWLAGSNLGFAWNVPADPSASRPYPYVWAVMLDEAALTACEAGQCVVEYPHIWSPDLAFQYATIMANERGDLGGVVLWGGGQYRLGCAVLLRDQFTAQEVGFDVLSVAASDMDTVRPETGDYLAVTPDSPTASTWAASCMTLSRARGEHPTAVHVARFGRAQDRP